MNHCYDDILHLPHHRSSARAHLSNRDRAAQFAPFAALTGLGAALQEAARLTECRPQLDPSEQELLDLQLRLLDRQLSQQPEVCVTYFRPDEKKAGGAICTVTGRVQKIDTYGHSLILSDGLRIPTEDLLALDSPVFSSLS